MSRSAPDATPTPGGSTSDEEISAGLRSGLAVYASVKAATQFADGKVGILGAVQTGLMAVAVPQGGALREAWERGGPGAWVSAGLLILQVGSFLAAVYCLIQALRPRLGPPPTPNRFSLPLLAAADGTPPPPGEEREREEIWQLIPVLARIAMAKHRYIARSTVWTGLMTVAVGVSFLVAPLLA
ncbi:hypothetical protein ABZ553_20785 [Streptomyces sparsogenes]|uniref:hypothetical protein n=1 Tax=Streptomyces sparsogenes TaxID=67365 RepID=UPI0033EDCAFB